MLQGWDPKTGIYCIHVQAENNTLWGEAQSHSFRHQFGSIENLASAELEVVHASGVQLQRKDGVCCADFRGRVHLEGGVSDSYVTVRCICEAAAKVEFVIRLIPREVPPKIRDEMALHDLCSSFELACSDKWVEDM